MIEISERSQQHVITEVAAKHDFNLKECEAISKLSTMTAGDTGTFGITKDGQLYLRANSSLNSTRKRDYTLKISLAEKWKFVEDETYVTIWQTACVMVCVCPGESTNCLPSPSPDTIVQTHPGSSTSTSDVTTESSSASDGTLHNSAVTTESSPVLTTTASDDTLHSSAVTRQPDPVLTTKVSDGVLHNSAVTTQSSPVLATTLKVVPGGPMKLTSVRPTKNWKYYKPDKSYRKPDRPEHHHEPNMKSEVDMAIVLCSVGLGTALIVILLLVCKLYMKSKRYWISEYKGCDKFAILFVCILHRKHSKEKNKHKSLDDIEMSRRKEKSPCCVPAEPPPGSELFYYYYADSEDCQADEPGLVRSNRREHHQSMLNQDGYLHGQSCSTSQKWLGAVTRQDSGDKTAEWVDEQRRITERRTSMPTALDDVSVESREDCAESLPELSVKSHPSLYRVRVNLLRDANFVLTNPLVKLAVPQASHWSQTRQSLTSSALGDRVVNQLP